MRYLWYGFLGLFSLGFLAVISGIVIAVGMFHYYGQQVPDFEALKTYHPPIVTRMYAGDGQLVAEFAQEKRVFVPIDNIPDLVKNAFIAAEDQNFYEHKGLDIMAIGRAVFTNIQNIAGNRRVVGASTITQQVAKNFLLTNERSLERKIKEAILAYRIEEALSKDRILELYLNEIYMGARAYGVAAASLIYFGKALDELGPGEAAYLASLPKAPNNYHPVRHYNAAIARRNWVLDRMGEESFISQAEAEYAKRTPLETVDSRERKKFDAKYYAEEIRRELAALYGEDSLYGGGLVVRSALEPKLQTIAIKVLRDGLQAYDRRHGYRGPITQITPSVDWPNQLRSINEPEGKLDDWYTAVVLKSGSKEASLGLENSTEITMTLDGVSWARDCLKNCYALGPEITKVSDVLDEGDVIYVAQVPKEIKEGQEPEYFWEIQQVPDIQGAIIAMDPHTGRVLAMQGGWKQDYSQFNRAVQAQRQTGSAFKPFVYMAALERGFTPATLVLDAPIAIEDRPGHFWSPSNYSHDYYGPTPIRVGVEKSKNLMTVRLAEFIGMDIITDYAKRFHIKEDMPPHLSMALGAGETTLLQITAAYGMVVNGGKEIKPTFIDRIQDRNGQTIFKHDQRPCQNCGQLIRWQTQEVPAVPDLRKQIADSRTAYQMTSILQGVVERGTGIRIAKLGRPLAGKTGTTNESKDTWFIGFSPDLVVGVFAGFDNPRSLGRRETGSSVAVPIFKDFMEQALKDEPIIPFRIPEGVRNVKINRKTGQRAKPGDEDVIWESFIKGTEPTDEMYILDGSGINVMSPDFYNPETGTMDYPSAPTQTNTTNQEPWNNSVIRQQPSSNKKPPSGGIISGTGGLY